jgi:hypothetical protein
MTAAESIRALLAPVLPGWPLQFGHWTDPGVGSRSAVLRPAGGAGAELVRRPQFTLSLIGGGPDDRQSAAESADLVVETTRATAGALVYLQAGEPVYIPTADGRPVFEIALSAITV